MLSLWTKVALQDDLVGHESESSPRVTSLLSFMCECHSYFNLNCKIQLLKSKTETFPCDVTISGSCSESRNCFLHYLTAKKQAENRNEQLHCLL